MSERSFGGVRQDQARVARDIDRLAMYGDDRAVTQLGEDLALLAYPVVASCVGRDLQDSLLRVGGCRRDTLYGEGFTYHQMEITYSRFEKSIQFPCSIQRASLQRDYSDGLLIIRLRCE